MKKIIILLLLAISITSCGVHTKESITKNKVSAKNLDPQKILKEISKNTLTDSTYSYSSKLSFSKDGDMKPKPNLDIKIRNNKLIWTNMNFIVPLGRALITPEGAKGYIKIPKKKYFDSDYSILEDKIQLYDLEYNQIEDLLQGRSLFKLDLNNYSVTIKDDYWFVDYLKNETLLAEKSTTDVARSLYFDGDYNLVKEVIIKPDDLDTVEIIYSDFEEINGKKQPKNIQINAKNEKHTIEIILEHKSIIANETLEIPFQIPEGYEKMELK